QARLGLPAQEPLRHRQSRTRGRPPLRVHEKSVSSVPFAYERLRLNQVATKPPAARASRAIPLGSGTGREENVMSSIPALCRGDGAKNSSLTVRPAKAEISASAEMGSSTALSQP